MAPQKSRPFPSVLSINLMLTVTAKHFEPQLRTTPP